MSNINNWVVLHKLDEELKSKIKLFYIFGESGEEVMFVTNDDKVYAFGINENGLLGLGNNYSADKPLIVNELSHKQIIDIRSGNEFMIALSKTGLCYSWGNNSYGQIGNGLQVADNVPKLVNGLQNINIVGISCGYHHSIVVTNNGLVYGFGRNDWGQIGCNNTTHQLSPILINGFNNEKIKTVSCGPLHSLALTESGHVFGWGYNAYGELGFGDNTNQMTPKLINMNGVIISQISCGYFMSLLLSSDGDIYGFGCNDCGQIGSGNTSFPHKIVNNNKFISISSQFIHNSYTSVAQTEKEVYYVWGQTIYGVIVSPNETDLKSINEVFISYAKNKITHKPVCVDNNKCEEKPFHLIDKIANSFNNQEFYDFKFKFDDKVIYVHKTILKIGCKHFNTLFSQNWDKNDAKEIEIEDYSYETYYAFLKYLYTNCVEIEIEDVIELYHLANNYFEEKLKPKCIQIIKNNICVENAFTLYSSAVKYNFEEIEEICLKYMSINANKVCKTQSFKKCDPNVCKRFMEKAAELNAFK